jgi:hypothetical protein
MIHGRLGARHLGAAMVASSIALFLVIGALTSELMVAVEAKCRTVCGLTGEAVCRGAYRGRAT